MEGLLRVVDPKIRFMVGDDTDVGAFKREWAASGAFVGSGGLFFDTGGFPGGPTGTDTVPAWLTPGESILNKHATAMLGTETVRGFNAGSTAGMGNVYVTVEGNVWSAQDLSDAIAQRLANRWMQVGGVRPLGHYVLSFVRRGHCRTSTASRQ